jgi:hypothetical protein
VLGGHLTGTHSKLRLAWTAALGGLLRCYRTAGIDAQGTVVAELGHPALDADDGPDLLPPLVRLDGAYLAELVAVALNAALPVPIWPSSSGVGR